MNMIKLKEELQDILYTDHDERNKYMYNSICIYQYELDESYNDFYADDFNDEPNEDTEELRQIYKAIYYESIHEHLNDMLSTIIDDDDFNNIVESCTRASLWGSVLDIDILEYKNAYFIINNFNDITYYVNK